MFNVKVLTLEDRFRDRDASPNSLTGNGARLAQFAATLCGKHQRF